MSARIWLRSVWNGSSELLREGGCEAGNNGGEGKDAVEFGVDDFLFGGDCMLRLFGEYLLMLLAEFKSNC